MLTLHMKVVQLAGMEARVNLCRCVLPSATTDLFSDGAVFSSDNLQAASFFSAFIKLYLITSLEFVKTRS